MAEVSFFLPNLYGGGAERVMIDLAAGFANRGRKVDLVLGNTEGPYFSIIPSGVRVVDFGVSRVLKAVPHLVRYLKQERPAAMLSTLAHADFAAVAAKHLAGVETRLAVRLCNTTSAAETSSHPKRLFLRHLSRRFYPRADQIIAVSRGVADDFSRFTGIERERVRVIYNPVVSEDVLVKARQEVEHPWLSDGSGIPLVLGVGRLTAQKDFITLIQAVALVRARRPVRLMILGDGEERSSLQRAAEDLGIVADVCFPGFIENPFAYMAKSDLFVLPSRWEGLPGVLIQAMAVGVPVLATDCPGGSGEILSGKLRDRLMPMRDPATMAEKIAADLTAGCPSSIRSALRQRAAHFRSEKSIDEYEDVLLRINAQS